MVCIFPPCICHEMMGLDAMILFFWMLSFKPSFPLSSFTFIKRLFSSSSLSAIRVVSSAYLSLLIFLLAVLILACDSSSQAFCTMYSAYKLNKQGDNMQHWHIPFPIFNRSIVIIRVHLISSPFKTRSHVCHCPLVLLGRGLGNVLLTSPEFWHSALGHCGFPLSRDPFLTKVPNLLCLV